MSRVRRQIWKELCFSSGDCRRSELKADFSLTLTSTISEVRSFAIHNIVKKNILGLVIEKQPRNAKFEVCDLVPSSSKPSATKRGGWRGVSELTSTSSKLNILQFLASMMPKKSQDLSGMYKHIVQHLWTTLHQVFYTIILKEKSTQDRASCPSLHSLTPPWS